MPLAALILADSDGPASGEGARQALLSVAGQTLVEYQARSAHAAGALHIVVMVDAIPGALVAAFDRLRDEGLSIDVARNVSDAADRIHPDEDLLLFASGVIAGPGAISDLVSRGAPSVLAFADAPAVAHHERIDGYHRWAGLALLKGAHLRQTATMLGDWSLGPTLLRVAIQQEASRVTLHDPQDVTTVVNDAQAQALSRRLARSTSGEPLSPAETLIVPMASLAAASAMAKSISFDLMSTLVPVLFTAAVLLGWLEMTTLSFTMLLAGSFAGLTAARYANAAMRNALALQWRAEIERTAFALVILIASAFAWRDGAGWGVNVLALWAVANCTLLPRGPRWAPGSLDLALIMVVGTAAGATVTGLLLCVAWQLSAMAISRVRALLAAR